MPDVDYIPPVLIPDLSSLGPQSEWMAVLRAFVRGGASDHIAYTLQMNSVRLLGAAIREYEYGREQLVAFHASSNHYGVGFVAAASSHFECCIWQFERFLKHTRALRSALAAEPELKALIPRHLSFLSANAESRVTQLRHTIAHLERAALSKELPPDTPSVLMPLKQGLTLGGHTIEWSTLATWLTDAHTCVQALATFQRPPPAEAPAAHA